MLLVAVSRCTSAAAPSATVRHPRVLLVYQEDGAIPACVQMESTLVATLRTSLTPGLEFYREQLDLGRFPEFRDRTLEEIRTRYTDRKIDIVYYLGNLPIEVLPGVPTIYIANKLTDAVQQELRRRKSAILEYRVDPRKTIEVAHKLQPDARKVLVLSGVSMGDRAYLADFRRQLSSRESDFDIEYVDTASVEELLARVSQLSRDTIVLPISYSRDPAGNTYVPRDVVALLSDKSSAPVYAVSDSFIGTGAVGGYSVSWAKTGKAAAEMGIEILQGHEPANVKPPSEGTGSYIFDWRQLRRWGFPERALPAGSAIAFKLPSAWEQYRWRIVAAIALILAQFLLIAALLIHRRNRRRAETSLHDMTGRLLASQDDERRRIARDLHDGTGQHLSGMALTIGQVLEDFPPGHERLQQLLQDSHTASRLALDEVRTVSFVLHPPILDGVGLVSALQWYLDGLKRRTDVRINFDAPSDLGHLAPEAERALFRMVQEGITNVLRHSGGTALKISLANHAKAVTLSIEDNGHGMNAEQLSRLEGAATLGVGIAGMRERIRQLKGEFKLQSTADGTKVTATVPLQRNGYVAHHAG